MDEKNAHLKKMRSKNFTSEEEQRLLDLVQQFKDVLENKRTNATSNKEKAAAWQQIEDLFNMEATEVHRRREVLKMKYENMKKASKQTDSLVKTDTSKLMDAYQPSKIHKEKEVYQNKLSTRVSSKTNVLNLQEEEIKLRMRILQERHASEMEEIEKRKILLDLKIRKMKCELGED